MTALTASARPLERIQDDEEGVAAPPVVEVEVASSAAPFEYKRPLGRAFARGVSVGFYPRRDTLVAKLEVALEADAPEGMAHTLGRNWAVSELRRLEAAPRKVQRRLDRRGEDLQVAVEWAGCYQEFRGLARAVLAGKTPYRREQARSKIDALEGVVFLGESLEVLAKEAGLSQDSFRRSRLHRGRLLLEKAGASEGLMCLIDCPRDDADYEGRLRALIRSRQ
jgi:hypothetical protein